MPVLAGRQHGLDRLNPFERLALGGAIGAGSTVFCAPMLPCISAADVAYRNDKPFPIAADILRGMKPSIHGLNDLLRRFYDRHGWDRDPRGQERAAAARHTLACEVKTRAPRRAVLFGVTLAARDTLQGNLAASRSSIGSASLGGSVAGSIVTFVVNSAAGAFAGLIGLSVTYPLMYDPSSTKEILHFYVKLGRSEVGGTPAEMAERIYAGFSIKAPIVVASTAFTLGAYDTLLPLLPEEYRRWYLCKAAVAWNAATFGRLAGESVAEASVMASQSAHDDLFPGKATRPPRSIGLGAVRVGMPRDFGSRLPTAMLRTLPGAVAIALYDQAKELTLARRNFLPTPYDDAPL